MVLFGNFYGVMKCPMASLETSKLRDRKQEFVIRVPGGNTTNVTSKRSFDYENESFPIGVSAQMGGIRTEFHGTWVVIR